MKRLLFLMIVILSTITISYAQDSTKQVISSEQITEAERIIDKYTGKVYEFAENTAKALEQPAKQIFKSVVRLQIAKGIGKLLTLVLFIISLFIVLKNNAVSKYISDRKSWQESPGPLFLILIPIALGIWAVINTTTAIQYLLAPEWYGIKEIIELF